MPRIDPGDSSRNDVKKKKKAKVKRVLVRPPDQGEATRRREPSKILPGDKPQERSRGADAAIEKYKQTDHYVAQVQSARAHRPGFKSRKVGTDRQNVADSDRNYFKTHQRVEPGPAAKPKPAPTPKPNYRVDPSTGRATRIPIAKPPVAKPLKTAKDEPRTDAEVRKFLASGKRPQSVSTGPKSDPILKHVPPSVAMVVNPGGKVPKIGAMAASLLLGKEAAKPLHASAAALQGKNPVKGFKKGTDTGSDVIKHYLGKPHSKLGKIGAAVGGFALDTVIDPLNRTHINARSEVEHLERKANTYGAEAARATAKGKVKKAARKQAKSDKLKAKAKTASPHRGIQVGPSKKLQHTIPGTTRIAGTKAGQAIAHGAHDHPVSRRLGKTFVPHYRDRTVPTDVHEKDVAALRLRNHKEHAGDRHAERRGHAYDEHQKAIPDNPKDVTAAAERAPKGKTPNFVHHEVLTPEHRAVGEAKRTERSAKHTAATKTGRAEYETSQNDKAIRHKLIETFRRRDAGYTAREVGKLGHAHAHQLHSELTGEIQTLDTLIARLERRPAVSRSAKHSAQLARARTRRATAVKLQKNIDTRWGTYTSGAPARVVKGKTLPPLRTLKPLDQSIADLEHEAATLRDKRLNAHNAKFRGTQADKKLKGARNRRQFGGRTRAKIDAGFTPEDARRLKGIERRLGQFHREHHLEQIEPAVRGYMKASGNAKIKSIARGKARKGYRNAYGEDPLTGEKHPYYKVRKPVTGAEASYSDAERALKDKAFQSANHGHAAAQSKLKNAEAQLRTAAESQAGEHAMGRPGVSVLRNYGRTNPTTLHNLNNARASADAATAVREKAEQKATGMKVIHDPNTGKILGKTKVGERVPRHETQFSEADHAGKPVKGGMTWREYLDQARRSSVADLSRGGAVMVHMHHTEMDQLRRELEAHGLIDEPLPDYVHHMKAPDTIAELAGRMVGRKSRGANIAAGTHRRDPRPARTQNEHGQNFSEDLPTINANYIREAHRAIAAAEYLKHLTKIGKPLTKASKIDPETEGVYAITNKNITAVSKEEQDAFLAGKPDARKGAHVVLPKAIGDREIARGVEHKVRDTVGEWFDSVNREWKSIVTVYNLPFYQERNFYDDTLRFWYGDGKPKHLIQATRLMKSQIGFERGARNLHGGPAQQAILKQAEEDGVIRSGHYAVEFEHEGGKMTTRKVVGPLGRATSGLRAIGSFGEDIPRLASYLSALERGMTREQAASWVRIHHFDYSELTDSERWIRRFIPFWTFTSRNVALQSRTLLTRPGKISQFEAFREETAKLAGLPPDWDTTYLDETQQRSLPVPIRYGGTDKDPKIKVLYPGFSNTDLNRIPIPTGGKNMTDVGRQQFDMWASTITPLIKAPMELMANHSYFFRSPIYPDAQNTDVPKWVPAPNWANNPVVKKTLQAFGGDVITAPDPKSKKPILMWSGIADYMMRQMPQSGFVATIDTPVKNSRGQTAADRAIGQGTGIRMTGLDKTRGEQQVLRSRVATNTIARNDLRFRGKAADPNPEYSTIVSDRYDKLNKAVSADQQRLDQLTGKVDNTRLQSRPPSFQDQARQRQKARQAQFTPEAIRDRVKRRQQRLKLQAKLSERQR